MARLLDDLEFWLPSEFLTDDSVFEGGKPEGNGDFLNGWGKSVGIKSDLGSPVDSLSEEDDFTMFLNRKIVLPSFRDLKSSSDYREYGCKLSGSPQSTLCGLKPVSTRESPKCVSGIASPLGGNDLTVWDLLNAASGEVSRLRVNEKPADVYPANLMFPDMTPLPLAVPRNNANTSPGFHANLECEAYYGYQQFLEKQPRAKYGVWGFENPANQFYIGNRGGNLRMATPNILPCQRQNQPLPNSTMQGVFLGENGMKKERTGTGVFLPRRYEAISSETGKKSGCSVLLPERVVHALNVNLHSLNSSLGVQSRVIENHGAPGFDAPSKHGNSPMMARQRRNLGRKPTMNQELRLPQEWTY